jgi:hypothetical protein
MLLRLFNRLPRRIRFFVWRWLYPGYRCEWCIGQELSHGCYCLHAGCIAPCVDAGRVRAFLRGALRG